MKSEIIGPITEISPIASGPGVRMGSYLRKAYGKGRWRKLRGVGTVELPNGTRRRVELHWDEAHGIGRRNMKIKRYIGKQ